MSLPPLQESTVFNSSYFVDPNASLGFATADARYIQIGGSGVLSTLSVSGNADVGSLSIGGSATNLNAITGITAGTAAASKALITDTNIDINGINNVGCASSHILSTASQENSVLFLNHACRIQRNGASIGNRASIAFAVTNAVPATGWTPSCIISNERTGSGGIGSFIVAIRGTTTTNAALTDRLVITSDGRTYMSTGSSMTFSGFSGTSFFNVSGPIHTYTSSFMTDTNYEMAYSAQTPNGIQFSIQLNKGAQATSSNSAFIGTLTNNDLRFGVNNSTKMTLTTNGWLGIGTTGANYPVDVTISQLVNVTSWGIVQSTGAAYSQVGSANYYIAMRTGDGVRAGFVLLTSDRRVKRDIEPISEEAVDAFMTKCIPKQYIIKKTGQQQYGWISQDIAKAGFHGILSYDEPHENLPAESDDDIPDRLMTVNYERIPALLQLELIRQRKEIAALKERLDALNI